ncbi:MAG: PAS domain S-box protein [Chitinophagaceae bacterium]|nr:MAG: PAS domain S-box protein [Chitinophagaceae bacterium]
MIGNAHLLEIFKLSPMPAVIVSTNTPAFTIIYANDVWVSMINKTDSTNNVAGKSLTELLKDPGLGEVLDNTVRLKKQLDYTFPASISASHKFSKAFNIPLVSENGEVEYILHQLSVNENKGYPAENTKHTITQKRGIKTGVGKEKSSSNDNISDRENTLLERIGDAYFSVDHNWNITYLNNNAANIVGMPREELLNRNLFTIYPEEIGGEFYENYRTAVRLQETVRFKSYLEIVNAWLEVTVHPTDKGLSVFIRDVTAPQLADERIKDSEEKSRLIMNGALDAIICMDTNGDVTFWNARAETIFGWHADEVMGRQLSSFIIPERYRKRHDEGLLRYLQTGTKVIMNKLLELDGMRRDGEEFPIELTVIPISQATDKFFCAFVRDISERKIAEEQIRLSNQELEQFAYVASHDLQEPLRMVTSFLTQLEKRYNDKLDEKAKQYIYFAVDGARRMRQIILDLLGFSRIGKWSDAPELLDLNQLATEAMLLYSQRIDESQAIINVSKLPTIASYRTPLEQVFQNLISNALKYRREGIPPIVDINWKENNQDWIFSVSDNGIGIAEEHFERVFVIFQRLHHRDKYSGTGIGLAIVKKIITNLGGKIWVEPRKESGTTFVFTIPKSK